MRNTKHVASKTVAGENQQLETTIGELRKTVTLLQRKRRTLSLKQPFPPNRLPLPHNHHLTPYPTSPPTGHRVPTLVTRHTTPPSPLLLSHGLHSGVTSTTTLIQPAPTASLPFMTAVSPKPPTRVQPNELHFRAQWSGLQGHDPPPPAPPANNGPHTIPVSNRFTLDLPLQSVPGTVWPYQCGPKRFFSPSELKAIVCKLGSPVRQNHKEEHMKRRESKCPKVPKKKKKKKKEQLEMIVNTVLPVLSRFAHHPDIPAQARPFDPRHTSDLASDPDLTHFKTGTMAVNRETDFCE